MKKVKLILSQISWRKILTFSFFLILATIFWLMQVYRQQFETTLVVPLKYVNVPDSIVFRNKLPSQLNVKVKDDGAALFRYFFTYQRDSLKIDVRKLIANIDGSLLQGTVFEQIIKQHLLPNSKLVDYSPVAISCRYDALKSKRLPVVFDTQINIAVGYLLSGEIKVIPDSITAYGSATILNKVSYVHTIGDTINDYSSKSASSFKLKEEANVKFVPSDVKVEIPIEEFTQKELDIPIICDSIPSNIDVKFFPSNIKISFFVGLSRYKLITKDDFQIKLNYNDLVNISTMVSPLKLTKTPNYIRNLKMDPSEVEFIFEQK